MKKSLFTLLFIITLLFSQEFLDDDFDGVENSFDRCPNTDITQIVDKNGCPVEKLNFAQKPVFDISLGYYKARYQNSTQNSRYINFITDYKNFSLYISGGDYSIDSQERESDDITLSLSYSQFSENLSHRFTLGSIIANSQDSQNKTDYFLAYQVRKYIDNFDASLYLKHTFVKDTDARDKNFAKLSVGYSFQDDTYLSLSYSKSNSIYENTSDIEEGSLFFNKPLSDYLYLEGSYSIDLKKSSNYSTYIGIGYIF